MLSLFPVQPCGIPRAKRPFVVSETVADRRGVGVDPCRLASLHGTRMQPVLNLPWRAEVGGNLTHRVPPILLRNLVPQIRHQSAIVTENRIAKGENLRKEPIQPSACV